MSTNPTTEATTPTIMSTTPANVLLNIPFPTVTLTLPVDMTATILSPFLTDTPVLQDTATQTILSAVSDMKILSYEDAEEIFQAMKTTAEACDDSPPYQLAPTPTWSEDEWP